MGRQETVWERAGGGQQHGRLNRHEAGGGIQGHQPHLQVLLVCVTNPDPDKKCIEVLEPNLSNLNSTLISISVLELALFGANLDMNLQISDLGNPDPETSVYQ